MREEVLTGPQWAALEREVRGRLEFARLSLRVHSRGLLSDVRGLRLRDAARSLLIVVQSARDEKRLADELVRILNRRGAPS